MSTLSSQENTCNYLQLSCLGFVPLSCGATGVEFHSDPVTLDAQFS